MSGAVNHTSCVLCSSWSILRTGQTLWKIVEEIVVFSGRKSTTFFDVKWPQLSTSTSKTDTSTIKFQHLLVAHGLVQYVQSAIHVGGHTLDVVITSGETPVNLMHYDPPTLSDQSLIIGQLDATSITGVDSVLCVCHRRWRSFDIDAFSLDLTCACVLCFSWSIVSTGQSLWKRVEEIVVLSARKSSIFFDVKRLTSTLNVNVLAIYFRTKNWHHSSIDIRCIEIKHRAENY